MLTVHGPTPAAGAPVRIGRPVVHFIGPGFELAALQGGILSLWWRGQECVRYCARRPTIRGRSFLLCPLLLYSIYFMLHRYQNRLYFCVWIEGGRPGQFRDSMRTHEGPQTFIIWVKL